MKKLNKCLSFVLSGFMFASSSALANGFDWPHGGSVMHSSPFSQCGYGAYGHGSWFSPSKPWGPPPTPYNPVSPYGPYNPNSSKCVCTNDSGKFALVVGGFDGWYGYSGMKEVEKILDKMLLIEADGVIGDVNSCSLVTNLLTQALAQSSSYPWTIKEDSSEMRLLKALSATAAKDMEREFRACVLKAWQRASEIVLRDILGYPGNMTCLLLAPGSQSVIYTSDPAQLRKVPNIVSLICRRFFDELEMLMVFHGKGPNNKDMRWKKDKIEDHGEEDGTYSIRGRSGSFEQLAKAVMELIKDGSAAKAADMACNYYKTEEFRICDTCRAALGVKNELPDAVTCHAVLRSALSGFFKWFAAAQLTGSLEAFANQEGAPLQSGSGT